MSPSKTWIFMATKLEAYDVIYEFNMAKTSANSYSCPQFNLCITGMGSIAMATAIGAKLSQIEKAYNIGFAGALSDALSLYDIVQVKSCSKHLQSSESTPKQSLSFAKKCFPIIETSKQGQNLLTVDIPLFDPTLRVSLRNNFDLVDMEGYGFAHALQNYDIDYAIYKIISDKAGKNKVGLEIDPATISKHIPKIVENITANN